MALGRGALNTVYRAMGKMKYVGEKIGGGVKNYLRENERLNNLAKEKMDERYGKGGWSDSPYHMGELNQFKKQIKGKR